MARRGFGRKRPAFGKGALAGAIAGLAGAWTMNQFQALLSNATPKKQENEAEAQKQQEQASGGEDGDATQKLAARIGRAVLGRLITKHERDVGGPIVHYAFGCASGALYGAGAELSPLLSRGFGLPLAAALWLAADEAAVPALGLSKSPLDYPLSSHLSALAAHGVYGVTTELARRALRSVLSTR
jgi:putative membrane protein